ncbi:hypothetical protein CHU98_g10532 [Xylaria longipes]|nr:hypothetical protein CHU98_g10532 [Xylaria longipes]
MPYVAAANMRSDWTPGAERSGGRSNPRIVQRAGPTEPSRGRVWADDAPADLRGTRRFHPLAMAKQMHQFRHYVMKTNAGAAVLSR